MEGGGSRRKELFDLAHLANLQKLLPPSLDVFSIASSKLCLFAILIAAPLALFAFRHSCQTSSEGFLLCLQYALLASSMIFPISSNDQKMRKGASFDLGTCWAITSFIHEMRKSIAESISEVEEKLHGNVFISVAFSMMATSLACFHSGRGSKMGNCSKNNNM